MPATNFPGGASSFGVPLFGQGSIYDMPTGAVWFVSNRSGVVNGDGTGRNGPMQSLADAVARASSGDTIFVLSGHAENVTASNVFSGTNASGPNTGAQVIPTNVRIIGEGVGNSRPTFTFTAAASTIALASAGSTIENCILLCPQTGTTTAAALVTVTANGCAVRANRIMMAASATALATTGISLSSLASDCQITDNLGHATTGTPTSFISTTGTVGPARVFVQRNNAILPLSATTGGLVDTSANSGTAPLDWYVTDNNFGNITASSTVALKGVSGMTGFVAYNNLGITNATGGVAAFNTPGSTFLGQTFGGVTAKNGILTPAASG